MLNTVIFDMDGLLIDSEPLWGEAMKEVFESLNLQLTPSHYMQTTGLRTQEVVEHWHRHFQWKEKTPDQVVGEILESVTGKILDKGLPMEGLLPILDFFQARRFKIGLASSSPLQLITTVLEHLSIRDRFQAIYSAENEAFGKSHPAVYLACVNELHSDPSACIAFEDSVNGMIAAKAARIKTVVVPEAHRRDDPRYVLADLQLASLADFGEKELALLNAI